MTHVCLFVVVVQYCVVAVVTVTCTDMSPTDYRVDNESLLIGGEVCLWTEFADDDSIMPRLWSADILSVAVS